MTERTLREQISAVTRFNFDGFTANGDPQGRWMLADDVLRILDAHTAAQPAPDAVAEAEPVAWLYTRKGFLPHVSKNKPEYHDLVSVTPLYPAKEPRT